MAFFDVKAAFWLLVALLATTDSVLCCAGRYEKTQHGYRIYEYDFHKQLTAQERGKVKAGLGGKVAEFADSKVSTFPEGFCGTIPNIRGIRLSNAGLKNFEYDAFKKCHNLHFLVLSWNEIEELPESLLERQTVLEELDLSHNQLKIVPAGMFDKKHILKTLDLSHNQLASFMMNTVHIPLTYINLESNNIYDVSFQFKPRNYRHLRVNLNDNYLHCPAILMLLQKEVTLSTGVKAVEGVIPLNFQGYACYNTHPLESQPRVAKIGETDETMRQYVDERAQKLDEAFGSKIRSLEQCCSERPSASDIEDIVSKATLEAQQDYEKLLKSSMDQMEQSLDQNVSAVASACQNQAQSLKEKQDELQAASEIQAQEMSDLRSEMSSKDSSQSIKDLEAKLLKLDETFQDKTSKLSSDHSSLSETVNFFSVKQKADSEKISKHDQEIQQLKDNSAAYEGKLEAVESLKTDFEAQKKQYLLLETSTKIGHEDLKEELSRVKAKQEAQNPYYSELKKSIESNKEAQEKQLSALESSIKADQEVQNKRISKLEDEASKVEQNLQTVRGEQKAGSDRILKNEREIEQLVGKTQVLEGKVSQFGAIESVKADLESQKQKHNLLEKLLDRDREVQKLFEGSIKKDLLVQSKDVSRLEEEMRDVRKGLKTQSPDLDSVKSAQEAQKKLLSVLEEALKSLENFFKKDQELQNRDLSKLETDIQQVDLSISGVEKELRKFVERLASLEEAVFKSRSFQ